MHMPTLRIEHPVPNFEGWKKVFDSDPIGRKRSGVTHYRVYRPLNENVAIVELDFANMEDLEKTQAALKGLWTKVEGTVMTNPQTRILDIVEEKNV
jgi:hypothetical protein